VELFYAISVRISKRCPGAEARSKERSREYTARVREFLSKRKKELKESREAAKALREMGK
jgi:hypothetical protein